MDARPLLEVIDLGTDVPYAGALALQHELVARRAAGEIGDRLLLLEHGPVVTVGRGATAAVAARAEVPVVEVERGGEATYHGPGQLVGYPILALAPAERDLHRHLRRLEDVLVAALGDLGVEAGVNPPHTGVWIGARKVASIGVAVRRWVTYHGFALNVTTNLAAFAAFSPCGLDPAVMTSLQAVLGAAPSPAQVRAAVVRRFAERFGRRLVGS